MVFVESAQPAGVMTAHLWVKAIDKEKPIPATLSHEIMTKLLRHKLYVSKVA